jgi:hypothetical protein
MLVPKDYRVPRWLTPGNIEDQFDEGRYLRARLTFTRKFPRRQARKRTGGDDRVCELFAEPTTAIPSARDPSTRAPMQVQSPHPRSTFSQPRSRVSSFRCYHQIPVPATPPLSVAPGSHLSTRPKRARFGRLSRDLALFRIRGGWSIPM